MQSASKTGFGTGIQTGVRAEAHSIRRLPSISSAQFGNNDIGEVSKQNMHIVYTYKNMENEVSISSSYYL